MNEKELSRVEAILRSTLSKENYTDVPQSRIESLLIALMDLIKNGSSSSGTINSTEIDAIFGGNL